MNKQHNKDWEEGFEVGAKAERIIHTIFWCNLCEKYIDRDEVEMSNHSTSKAVIFSHNDNHLLELKQLSHNKGEDES